MTESRDFEFNIPEKYQSEFMDKLAEVLEWYGAHFNSIDNKGKTVKLRAEKRVKGPTPVVRENKGSFTPGMAPPI
jgi:hypothetical protein